MIQEVLTQVLANKYTSNEIEKKRLIEILFLAQEYLNKHNLSTVEIRFSKRMKALGFCHDSGYAIALNLHYALFGDINRIKETILHEIAHALTPGEGHFIEWQKKAIELGLSYEHIQRYKQL